MRSENLFGFVNQRFSVRECQDRFLYNIFSVDCSITKEVVVAVDTILTKFDQEVDSFRDRTHQVFLPLDLIHQKLGRRIPKESSKTLMVVSTLSSALLLLHRVQRRVQGRVKWRCSWVKGEYRTRKRGHDETRRILRQEKLRTRGVTVSN